MVDPDLQALPGQQVLIEMKETHWVKTFWKEMTRQLLHIELIGGLRLVVQWRIPIKINTNQSHYNMFFFTNLATLL